MIVSGHQPNLLPGESVMTKMAAADVFVFCDEMQFVRHGWVNRNRLDERTPIVVPFDSRDRYAPINRVRIADPTGRARAKVARTLRMRLGDRAERYAAEFERPYELLAGLNVALLGHLCRDLGIATPWAFQSHLATGRGWCPMDTEDEAEVLTVSDKLAAMTAELGGSVWLSGPSGRGYLDERPFLERGIRVDYWQHEGPNLSAILRACRV